MPAQATDWGTPSRPPGGFRRRKPSTSMALSLIGRSIPGTRRITSEPAGAEAHVLRHVLRHHGTWKNSGISSTLGDRFVLPSPSSHHETTKIGFSSTRPVMTMLHEGTTSLGLDIYGDINLSTSTRNLPGHLSLHFSHFEQATTCLHLPCPSEQHPSDLQFPTDPV